MKSPMWYWRAFKGTLVTRLLKPAVVTIHHGIKPDQVIHLWPGDKLDINVEKKS